MSAATNNFLASIARYYTEGAPSRPSLDALTFVLPNKRSVMFLKQYLRDSVNGVVMMPRMMTMRNFLSIYAKYPEADAMSLLFTLYDAYRNVMREKGRGAAVREFDSFVFWGDMMLSDFDDIDKSLVDAGELFKNIKNIKEIQADYLTGEQKDIVRRIWGENRFTAETERFWLHLGDGERGNKLGAKFIYLWEILADIYREFHRLLVLKDASSEGGQYRQAVEGIKDFKENDFGGPMNYVFVGFNDLTNAEVMVLEHLKKHNVASFFWDTSPLGLTAQDGRASNPRPLERLSVLIREFPMPADYQPGNEECVREVCVYSLPSNVAQAKYVSVLLDHWWRENLFDVGNAINTAIILPDQSLLLPVLLAIPEEVVALNISMGLSYRTTTFAILLHAIISMQLRARKLHGEYHFYYEDVIEVLSHPHIHAIVPDEADAITAMIAENHMYNIPVRRIVEAYPDLKAVFNPVKEACDVREVAAYLGVLLNWLEQSIVTVSGDKSTVTVPKFEIEAITFFRSQLDMLTRLALEHGLEMTEHTFFHLFERVFNARGLTLAGTPLKGLQILGVLETRALDFDNVIILSVNEGVLPRKQYAKTMIPSALRTGYRLPDFNSLEWSYAYCFYRIVARARRVALLYDSRVDGVGYGEKSRYISQLQYLMPSVRLVEKEITMGASSGTNKSITIEKTPRVLAILNEFRTGGRRCLSATALKTYRKCRLRFYLEYVRDMRGSDELVDYITASEYGTIVHNVIQSIFAPYANELITAAHFERWLDRACTDIENAVIKELIRIHYRELSHDSAMDNLTAEGRLAVNQIAFIVRSNLRAELEKYAAEPFVFLENEMKVDSVKQTLPWKINDELSINFKMSIDRVDRMADNELRFIDFKTGSEDTYTDRLDTLFLGVSTGKDGLLQILTYCEAYLSMVDSKALIVPSIHPLRELSAAKGLKDICVNRKPIGTYNAIRDEFRPLIEKLIAEVFDPKQAFYQVENEQNCKFCPFLSLCGRSPKDY